MQEKANKDSGALLETLHKNANMAKETLLEVMPKVKSTELKDELTAQLDTYEKYLKGLGQQLKKGDGETKMQKFMTKMSAKIGVGTKTLTDSSEQCIAQMLIEHSADSMTECIRAMRECENGCCSEEAISLAKELAEIEEKFMEKMKKRL